MGLDEYRRKRNFDRTPEPAGKQRAKRGKLAFVVQKHAASRLHYDFRLELDGVLKSWAVPKGPSLDPGEKRLAVAVEDHPLDYADFEGTIPANEYGGGTVIVWDRGTWTTDEDAAAALKAGKLKFRLKGSKLSGGWTLVRIRSRGSDGDKNWLLIKERDDEARPIDEYDVLEAEPASVISGRTLDEVTAAPEKSWTSGRARRAKAADPVQKRLAERQRVKAGVETLAHRGKARVTLAAPKPKSKKKASKRGGGRRVKSPPESLDVQLATLASEAPSGDQWLHEIKFDGYRLLARVDGGKTTLLTRNHLDWTKRFPSLAAELSALPVQNAVLDGEVVALLPSGVSNFQTLQNAFNGEGTEHLVYYAFDLLFLDGEDLRKEPLSARKEKLRELLAGTNEKSRVQYSDHLAGDGAEFLAQCCRLGLEGIISKRADRPYRGGRSGDWLKVKCVQRDEFVIGGFTDPMASRKGLGALLVGYYEAEGRLVYAGRVGTGFSDQVLLTLRRRLGALEQATTPFAGMTKRETGRGVHWVRPELVAQVEYGNWTGDGLLRHPSFQGLREDKPASAVVRELPSETAIGGKKSRGKRRRRSPEMPGPKSTRNSRSVSTSTRKNGSGAESEVAGVRLTNPDRVLYADQGITKLGLASYYADVADWILPHIAGRPLSLVRCPGGQQKTCFYQKHAAAGTPEALERIPIKEKDGTAEYLMVHDAAGLISLVQMGVLEIHPWGSRADDVDRPDRMIFDLDPDPAVAWERVVATAHRLRERLLELGLQSFVKTTGGKGLHVYVPLQRRQGWDEVKEFSRAVVAELEREEPRSYTVNMSKAARRGKIFLDYLRNDRGATAVAPYSTRAKAGATVSVPLDWDELSPAVRSDHFEITSVPVRLKSLRHDPWEEFFTVRQSLTAKARKAVGVGKG